MKSVYTYPTIPSLDLFRDIFEQGEGLLHNPDTAKPTDIIGFEIAVSHHPDSSHALLTEFIGDFITMGEGSTARITNWQQIPEERQQPAALLAMKMNCLRIPWEPLVSTSLLAIQNIDKTLAARIIVLPSLILIANGAYYDDITLVNGNFDHNQNMISNNFSVLRRISTSNHEKLGFKADEARDLEFLRQLMPLRESHYDTSLPALKLQLEE